MKKLVFVIIAGILFANPGFGKEELKVSNLELNYPMPAIPFYHFRADLELPYESVIEVVARVDGKALRFSNLYREGELGHMDQPHQSQRPPSGYGLSENGTRYRKPTVVGWVKWEPGREYKIEIAVRLKKKVKASKEDLWISKEVQVRAPEQVPVFDTAWKGYKSLVITETAGIDRKREKVEALLPFYPDEARDLKREIREPD